MGVAVVPKGHLSQVPQSAGSLQRRLVLLGLLARAAPAYRRPTGLNRVAPKV